MFSTSNEHFIRKLTFLITDQHYFSFKKILSFILNLSHELEQKLAPNAKSALYSHHLRRQKYLKRALLMHNESHKYLETTLFFFLQLQFFHFSPIYFIFERHIFKFDFIFNYSATLFVIVRW